MAFILSIRCKQGDETITYWVCYHDCSMMAMDGSHTVIVPNEANLLQLRLLGWKRRYDGRYLCPEHAYKEKS